MASLVQVALRIAAPPERVFEAFTAEIAAWWRPNMLFQFTPRPGGRLAFEPGPDGRLVEAWADGEVFEIGRITAWEPGRRLAFTWRQAGFPPDRTTAVEVRFEPVETGTRVIVEHGGWDGVPQASAVRHGFPDGVFLTRHGEWWRALLGELAKRLG